MNMTHEISSHVTELYSSHFTGQHTTGPRHPTTPHSYTHTHLHHRKVPLLGCAVKAADTDVAREEEEVAAALLDEQLW